MSAAPRSMVSLFGHDPAGYRAHPLHAAGRTYQETNCYSDVVIELLHARGDEPLAALGSTVRIDFEGDQWTFFKPHPADLEALFGIDVHEMQPHRPLPDQIAEQIAIAQTLIVELDAWHLPDTASTSYRSEHVKTCVAAEAIDRDAQRLRYYHNSSLHELGGEDYRGALRVDGSARADVLAPYTEIVRFDERRRLEGERLRGGARRLLRGHLEHRPATNPFERFGERLVEDLPALLAGDAAGRHAYTFATVRMAGAGFELCDALARWLLGPDAAAASAALQRIVAGCKALGFKLARRRVFDPTQALATLGLAWDEAICALDDALA